MSRRLTVAAVGLLLLGLCVRPTGADTPAGAEIRLLEDLKFLTSDACEGRGIGSKGIDLAAEYIERQFVNAGLKPGGPGGSYFQPFMVTTGLKVGAGNHLVLKGPLGQTIALEHNKHFTAWSFGGNGKVEAPVVFAGHGITSTDPKYDDYAGLDVAGKIVIVLTATPRFGHAEASLFPTADTKADGPFGVRARVENALQHKAAAVLIVNSRAQARFGDLLPRPFIFARTGDPVPLPTAFLQRDLADTLLVSVKGMRLPDVEQATDADLKPRGTALSGWTCRLETDITLTRVKARNVVGVLEGSGPLAKETVVIGAHYDHVGMFGALRPFPSAIKAFSPPGGIGGVGFPLARLADSAIHHGADDNASGTVAVVELARRFGAQKARKGRRLVFMAFSGEESGLLGSAYYCRHPTFPLQDTTTMLNLDMVGRLQDDKLLVGGVQSAKPFPQLLDRVNEKHRFGIVKDPSGGGPSDHASFYARKVPVFFFFTGFHEQYPCPTDRVETINVPGLRRVVDLVGDLAAEVASLPARPEYAKTPGFDRSKTLWSSSPSVGVIPDYRATGPGVVVEGLVKDSAAAMAGLKKGDRVLAIAGKKVDSPSAFLNATRALTPGEPVEIAVERDSRRQSLTVELIHPRAGLTDPWFGFLPNRADTRPGILLAEVPKNSPAAKAGLQKGDRVVAVAGAPVPDRRTYLNAVRNLQPGVDVRLTVDRGGRPQDFQVRTPGKPKAPSK